MDGPLDRFQFRTQELVNQYPPRLHHPSKRVVYDIACPAGCVHSGQLTYTRWPTMALPESVDPAASTERVTIHPTAYEYGDYADDAVHWYVNFADACLFCAYGTSLLAQDELQVAEHPSLASLTVALRALGHDALTTDGNRPTPILVMGAERRCRLATDVNSEEGRPYGLYGGMFGMAPEIVVRHATERIEPPTVSNIIAMVAPTGGTGSYAAREIEHILTTAHTAFCAARMESERALGGSTPVSVHTGWWGCGVFGGNKVLMAMLQVLAAQMAGIDQLHFYTVTDREVDTMYYAHGRLGEIGDGGSIATSECIRRVVALELRWGVGDGN